MFCKEKCDDRAGADPHIIINKSAYTAKKQSTGYAADKSRQHRHNYLKRLYKHKHKRRKQPKPTYVSLKCINRPEIAFKPCLEHKQTQKDADGNSHLYKTDAFTVKTSFVLPTNPVLTRSTACFCRRFVQWLLNHNIE